MKVANILQPLKIQKLYCYSAREVTFNIFIKQKNIVHFSSSKV